MKRKSDQRPALTRRDPNATVHVHPEPKRAVVGCGGVIKPRSVGYRPFFWAVMRQPDEYPEPVIQAFP